jgi:TonB-dependent receptor
MPQVNTRWNVIGCEDTAGSLATGGQKCAYGYVPNSNILNAGIGSTPAGTTTLTQAQYQELIKSTLTLNPSAQFYGGSKDRPATLLNGWNQIDIDKLFQLAGIPVRLDCFHKCTASDGKVYDMPYSSFREKSTAAYLMEDFEIPMWGGMELVGNVGARVVRTEVEATGFMAFRSIRKNAGWHAVNNPTDVSSYVVSQNTAIKDSATDVMPSLNLALWPIEEKLALRYSIGRTVARPPVSKLLPSGTCTISQVIEETEPDDTGSSPNQSCSGTMGNPALKPQTNTNQNLSLEWYANRDTSMSVNVFRQRGLIGAPTIATVRNNENVFKDSTAVDPQTGTPLKDYEFTYGQWDNALPSTRRGIEFGVKTALTFLPSVLRYTGIDANYSRLRSSQGMPTLDLISGDVLPVINEPKYSWNASLWYDDGAFQARVAMQVVAPRYYLFSPNTTTNIGVNNYPSVGTTSWRTAYNPGYPQFGNMTRYVDAKMSYRFKNGLEIFADVRNLTGERTQNTTGGYEDYANGIPNIYSDGYSGRRYTIGMTLRSPR